MRKAIHVVKQKMKETRNNLSKQFDQTMLQTLIAAMDVAEFYSPPRITEMAAKMGLRAGWSLDLTTNDEDGRAWDFNVPEMRNRAARKVLTDKPLLLIGNPMCTIYSCMNNINHARMAPEIVKARFDYARKHLAFAAALYKIQIQEGRYFLHEHPESASSWYEKCIKEVMEMNGVMKVVGDQCCYGLKAKGDEGTGPARKATGFMTNSPCIAMQLGRRCPNRQGGSTHQHVQLSNGRAAAAQLYHHNYAKQYAEA